MANETIQLMGRRMSLRRYAPEPIRQEHLDAIVNSIMRAPTAGNMMLYSVVQVEDRAKKDRLAETCNHAFIAGAPLTLLFLADMQRIYDFYQAFDVPEYCRANDLPFQKPQASNLFMSCCDALIAAQTSVLAAESLGIGSCYVGDIMGRCEEHQQMFQLPRWAFPIALVCYGYYPQDMERRLNTRFERQFIWFQDTYRRLSREQFKQMHAEIVDKFKGVLERKNLNLAELTYLNFTLGKVALEEARSVAVLLDRWMG
ncbi:MAG: nitroreductase family protein [Anaerolineae bacterium]